MLVLIIKKNKVSDRVILMVHISFSVFIFNLI